MKKQFAKILPLLSLSVLILSGCKYSENESSDSTSINLATFEITIKDSDTFLKREISTDTTNEEKRGEEFCTLYANGNYQLYAAAEEYDNHLIINVVDFTEKGCSFSKGYVFREHVLDAGSNSSIAKGQRKVVNFLGKKVVVGNITTNLSAKEKAFLDMIAAAEGTSNTNSPCGKADDGYRSIFGCDINSSRIFSDYSRHPARLYPTGWGSSSDASGRYQFKSDTWGELARKHGINDFSPSSQDRGAIIKIRERGANPNEITNFNTFNNTVYYLRDEWASMPHSQYGQKTYNSGPLYDLYLKALNQY